jgi:Superfamily II DNA/RNA helicases, SNF2 family
MMKMKFMPHQTKALITTEPFNRVAYYLDMGLGKTFVGAEKMWRLNNAVNLVICQKSKIDDWIDHFKEYYGDDCYTYDLTDKQQVKYFQNDIVNYHGGLQLIGVINYETAFRRSYIAHITGFTLMLDESSLISNENAKRSKFILKLKPESAILLSGTPTAGKYERLWSQVQLLGWNISKKAFWNSYVDTVWIDDGVGFKREKIIGYKRVEHLKRKLAEYGAVFMKTEEVLNLPDQIEQKIFVEATKEYKYFIKNSLVQFEGELIGTTHCNGEEEFYRVIELVGDNSLTKMLYARQLCGQYHKEKLQALRDLVESTEDRLIIFYNFTEELRQMQNQLDELNRPYSVLNGTQKDLTAYENCSDSITFIQYQAGAMGGNFQKANKIIYYTLPLGKGSCDFWEQSKKRIHRIGQNETCFYYYLLVKGSVEEDNLASLKVGKDYTDELFKKS